MTHVTAAEWNQLIETYALCTAVLAIIYFFSLIYGANMNNHPQEDLNIGIADPTKVPEDIKRRERICGNNVENIPLGLAVFWAAFLVQQLSNLSGYGSRETLALTILFVIYSGVRVLFVIFYMTALQPWRTVCFLIGWLSVFGAVALLVAAAFQTDVKKFASFP